MVGFCSGECLEVVRSVRGEEDDSVRLRPCLVKLRKPVLDSSAGFWGVPRRGWGSKIRDEWVKPEDETKMAEPGRAERLP